VLLALMFSARAAGCATQGSEVVPAGCEPSSFPGVCFRTESPPPVGYSTHL